MAVLRLVELVHGPDDEEDPRNRRPNDEAQGEPDKHLPEHFRAGYQSKTV